MKIFICSKRASLAQIVCGAKCIPSFLLYSLMLIFLGGNYALASIESSEKELRAAVIVGVLRFTTWPDPQNKQIDICLAGDPLSAKYLMRLSGQRKIKRSNIVVRIAANVSEVESCDALVLGNNIRIKKLDRMMAYVRSNPTVSLCDGCDRKDVPDATIYLRVRDERIHFEVNWEDAKENGILFDSSLLELASNRRQG